MLRTTTKTIQATTLDFLSFGTDMTVQHEEKSYQIKSSQLNKTWRTAALLQTTLDLESMLRMFSSEVYNTVLHSGISYRHAGSHSDLSIGRITKQSCSFQLSIENHELGEITFMSGKPFTQKQSDQLEFLLASLVYPLRNALQYLSSYQSSITDTLTGKNNRFILISTLKHEVRLYHRYNTPMSMLIIDVDHLKSVNNKYGRNAGDKIIQAAANILADNIRETDTLVRYAGDEFILILSNTTSHGAQTIAEHLRDVIENMQIIHKEKIINFTISIGAASVTENDTSISLLANTYEALRTSKREGRNRITLPSTELE